MIGGVVAALETTLKNSDGQLMCDKIVTGKPNSTILEILLKDHNIDKKELP